MSTTTALETGKIQPRLKAKYNAEIKKALQDARFNKSRAARALGLTRGQLYGRLRRLGLDAGD